MRINCFLFFLGVLQSYAVSSYAQITQLSLEETNIELGELFRKIEAQTDFYFFYNNDLIDRNTKVDINVKDKTLTEILDIVLKNTNINYLINNKAIILNPKSPPMPLTQQNGEPIIGANVVEKGTTNGVITDNDGKFSLTVQKNAVLQISYIGYLNQEIRIGNQTVLSILLREDLQTLDEVVVVGYGVQRKVTTSGAVSKVEGEEIVKMSTVNASKALSGLSPGIVIIDRGGAPGNDDPQIYLRGVGTTGNTSPLILVDGIEMSLSQVPSNEIESISLLKDAASSSIYGSRAAHGVILVTTKRGKTGKAKISYNGYVGLQDMAIRPEQVSAQEYVEMVNEASRNAGNAPIYSEERIQRIISGQDPYINHVDELYRKKYLTEHTLNITGGTESTRYMAMFNFLDQPGMINDTDYQRYTYRMNVDLDINKYLRLSSDLSYRHIDRESSSMLSTAQYRAFSMKPTQSATHDNGSYALDDQQVNPFVAADKNAVGAALYQKDNFIGQLKAELEPVKDLIFTGVVALNNTWSRNKVHNKNYKFYDANGNYVTQWNSPNGVYDERNNSYQLILRFLANYSKTFAEKHTVRLLYGMERESYRNYYSYAERKNLVSDELPDISLGSASNQYSNGYPEAWGINSFFGRVNYGYKDRYLLEMNIRADGSSRFADGNKWGIFPSVSGAWRISEESFMKVIDFVDNLKLRASWGQTGNERIPTNVGKFLYLPQYTTNNVVMDGSLVTGVYQSRMANPSLTWETVESADIGLDFAFLNNSIYGEIDLYTKDTKDILLSLAIPKFIGLDPPYQNVGVVRNRGIEMMLGYRKVKGDFKFSVAGNFSYNKNEWKDRLGDDDNIHDNWNIERSGYELNSFYIYKADGLIANEQELAEYKEKYTSDPRGMSVIKAGDVKLVDINKDGKIDSKDRQVFSSNIPKFSYGLTLTAEYKGFDLNILFQGAGGANRFFYGEFYQGPAYEVFTSVLFRDHWTEANQSRDAKVPRLEAANERNMSIYNSFYLKDVSYLRLKNLQIGYTLPKNMTQKIMVDNIRIYASGSNLFTLSGLDPGLDPESNSGRPNDYLPMKVFNLGINVIF